MIFRFLILLPMILVSCAGYQLGGSKPTHLAHIKSLHVPMFKNDTLLARGESYATNSAVDALTRDGTYRIVSDSKADAILEGRLSSVDYRQVSASRIDSLRSEELSLEVHLSWVLRDANNQTHILDRGNARGTSRYFARGNINTARANAMPDALRRASESMTSRIADGF